LLDLQNSVSQFALLDRQAVNGCFGICGSATGVFQFGIGLVGKFNQLRFDGLSGLHYCCNFAHVFCSINAKSPHSGGLCF